MADQTAEVQAGAYRNKRMKQIRMILGMNQTEFAHALGLKHSESISRYDRGGAPVPEGTYRLAEALVHLQGEVLPGDLPPLPREVLLGLEPMPAYAARD